MNVFASHQILCLTASHLLTPLYTPSSESSESESAWVSRSSVTDGKLRNRCSELNEERWVCRLPEDERLNEPDTGSAGSGSGGELSSSSEETMMGGGFRLVCELCDHFFALAAEATMKQLWSRWRNGPSTNHSRRGPCNDIVSMPFGAIPPWKCSEGSHPPLSSVAVAILQCSDNLHLVQSAD